MHPLKIASPDYCGINASCLHHSLSLNRSCDKVAVKSAKNTIFKTSEVRNKTQGTNTDVRKQVHKCSTQTQTEVSSITLTNSIKALDEDFDEPTSDASEVATSLPTVEPYQIDTTFIECPTYLDLADEGVTGPLIETPAEPTDKELCVVCQVNMKSNPFASSDTSDY